MKTFRDFIAEDYGANTPSLDEFKELIEKQCQPFLKLVGGIDNALSDNALYRGINRPTWESTYKVRKDREPRNSGVALHNALNDVLVKQTGIKHRSESIFVTGSKIDAREYGSVHFVFPVGDFQFAYVEDVADLTRYVWSKNSTNGGELYKAIDTLFGTQFFEMHKAYPYGWRFPETYDDEKGQKFKKLMGGLDEHLYAGMDIPSAALTIESEFPDEILAHNVGQLEFRTDDLLGAIHDMSEIMVECDEYIAIPFNMVIEEED